jgi:hypothetical protein
MQVTLIYLKQTILLLFVMQGIYNYIPETNHVSVIILIIILLLIEFLSQIGMLMVLVYFVGSVPNVTVYITDLCLSSCEERWVPVLSLKYKHCSQNRTKTPPLTPRSATERDPKPYPPPCLLSISSVLEVDVLQYVSPPKFHFLSSPS